MNTPDELSQEFIKWSIKYLSNKNNYDKLINDIFSNAEFYYSKDMKKVLNDLVMKLHKGSIEHGPPIHEQEWLDREIEMELLDLIGYGLLKLWNRERVKLP